MSEKVIEFEYDKRTDETYNLVALLEQRIGDQIHDPEPQYDGVLNSADKQSLTVLRYELNRLIETYQASLVKTEGSMGDIKFTTAADYCYPGSDPQT